MHKAVVMAGLVVLAMVAALEAAVVTEQTDVDLGLVYRDQPQKMVFPLINASPDSLRMLSVQPSCDCTTAQVVPPVIPPQAKGQVVVFFDPKGYEGRGKVKESVKLLTSDHMNPEILLTFAIDVRIGPEPEPRSLAFGKVERGARDTLKLAICAPKSDASGKATPFKVLSAKSDDDRITVTQAGNSSDDADQFLVVLSNRSGGGDLSSFVTVTTSDSLRGDIRVPVTASLAGDIIAEPGVIAFGPTLPGKYLQQTVKVSSPSSAKFKIVSVTSSLGQLAFEVSPLGEGSYSIKIKVKEDAPAGRVMGAISIKTDRAGEDPIEVKVAGYVRAS
ncbi:MAG TPA: DUF1573 domain-containing protein [bacterium]|nr:DUF1573 domain-containing protein [bacterium]